MNKDFLKYPSVIARPYDLSTRNTPQRKGLSAVLT